jgi:hypothetical protein
MNLAARLHCYRHYIGYEALVDIAVRSKDMVVDARQLINHRALGIEIDRRLHRHVVQARIVKTEDMVNMRMREEDGINTANAMAQRVLAMIRRAVDQYDAMNSGWIFKLKHCPNPRSAITRIGACACCAVARDHGDARTGACAKQRESNIGDAGCGSY